MKTAGIVSALLAVLCCSLFVCSSAKFTCSQHALWNIPEFECSSGNECILKRFECDSILDCRDFSDENHCPTQHAENCIKDFADKETLDGKPLQSWQCGNGMCILGCERCDGTIHCADLSDEIDCTADEAKPPCN